MKKIFLGSLALALTCHSALSDDSAGRMNALEKDNALLRQEIENVQQELAALRKRLPTAQSSSSTRTPTAAPAGSRAAYEAYAANMPIKAPPPPISPIYTWNGCSLGGHIGGGLGREDWSVDPSDALNTNTVFGSLIGLLSTVGGPTELGSHIVTGFIGGGQIGCDYQFGSHLVVGAQADLDWSDLKGNHTANFIFLNSVPRPESETFAAHTQIDRFGTVTGRLGFSSDQALFYVKGGGAWVRDSYTISAAATAPPGTNVPTMLGAASVTRWGWTVGAGFEYALLPNLSAMIEYDYLGFSNRPTIFSCSSINGPFSCGGNNVGPTFNTTVPVDVQQQVHAIKLGLNYRFNWWGGPISTRY
jgi:outer membrane immunogenic protein